MSLPKLKQFKTTQSAFEFVSLLEDLSSKSYSDNSKSISEIISGELNEDMYQVVTKSLPEVVAKGSANGLETWLRELKEEIKSAKVVRFDIPFNPTSKFISEIYNVLESKIDGEFLLEFNFKPDLLGGARISYGGKYHDGSVIKKLQEANFTESLSALIKE